MVHATDLAVRAVLVAGLAAARSATRFRLPALVLLRSREFCSRLAGSMMAMREPSDAPGDVVGCDDSDPAPRGLASVRHLTRRPLVVLPVAVEPDGSLSQRVVHNLSCDVLVVA
jgi:hypothetical protein